MCHMKKAETVQSIVCVIISFFSQRHYFNLKLNKYKENKRIELRTFFEGMKALYFLKHKAFVFLFDELGKWSKS